MRVVAPAGSVTAAREPLGSCASAVRWAAGGAVAAGAAGAPAPAAVIVGTADLYPFLARRDAFGGAETGIGRRAEVADAGRRAAAAGEPVDDAVRRDVANHAVVGYVQRAVSPDGKSLRKEQLRLCRRPAGAALSL